MLGARIAVLRKSAGLSQAQLAQKLQISASAVGMYEQGRREPSAEILAALSRIFGVSIDYLVTGEPINDGEKQQMAAKIMERVDVVGRREEKRARRPFSRQELAVLFAAMLMENE